MTALARDHVLGEHGVVGFVGEGRETGCTTSKASREARTVVAGEGGGVQSARGGESNKEEEDPPREVSEVEDDRCLRCHVPASAFRVEGLGFRVSGVEFRVSGFEFRISGFGCRVSG